MASIDAMTDATRPNARPAATNPTTSRSSSRVVPPDDLNGIERGVRMVEGRVQAIEGVLHQTTARIRTRSRRRRPCTTGNWPRDNFPARDTRPARSWGRRRPRPPRAGRRSQRRNHGASGRLDRGLTARERLARVAHIISQQHPAPFHHRAIERPQHQPAIRVGGERREARWRMRQAPPAIEQACQSMRKQRTAEHGTGHHIGFRDDRLRQQLDQVLRKPPDQRRLPEDAMRIQIDPAVIPVAEVEVPVEHEHVVLAQIGQRGLAQLIATGRPFDRVLTIAEFAYTTRPPTIVAATAPLSVQPSNGVFFDFDRNSLA